MDRTTFKAMFDCFTVVLSDHRPVLASNSLQVYVLVNTFLEAFLLRSKQNSITLILIASFLSSYINDGGVVVGMLGMYGYGHFDTNGNL